MGLIIRSSAIHAAGCYTTSPIAKGARVVEYTGPLIDKEEADRRYENKPITYLFAIGDGAEVIDGHGIAMFINHSCDANCETEEIDGHVWITAIRNIAAGAELCYDYCLYDGDEEDAPCNCGARRCRGSMFSPEELQRRKRLTRKQTAGDVKIPEMKDRAGAKKKTSYETKLKSDTAGSSAGKRKSSETRQGKKASVKKRILRTSNGKAGKKSSKRTGR